MFFTLGNSKSRRPLILQDVETNGAVAVDVGVVNLGSEVNLKTNESRYQYH